MKKINSKIIFSSFVLIMSVFFITKTASAVDYYTYNFPYDVVIAPPASSITVNISATPNAMTLPTNQTVLSWVTTGDPTECHASSSDWSGTKAASSGVAHQETISGLNIGTYIYEITCTKATSTASSSAMVVVSGPPLPTIRLRATPAVISSGSSSSLSWTTTNATSCVTSGGAWLNPGSRPINSATPESTGPLTSQSTYYLTCTGPNGSVQASATVYLNNPADQNPPTISYFQPFSCVNAGSNPRFAWATQNATSCNITRTTAPVINESVGTSSRASGGSLEADGLYYYLLSLPIVGNSSDYTLQCTNNGFQTTSQYAAVNSCSADFSISATPSIKSFVSGINPGTGNAGQIATYTVSVTPMSGFNAPVNLSIQSHPVMPRSTSFTFNPSTLVDLGNSYSSSVLTVGIDSSYFPALGSGSIYTPIVISGTSGGITHTVTVGADATGKTRPIYIER